MPTIEIFEPAGCCATSGAVIDQQTLRFNADLEWCRQNGVAVKRHNLSRNPQSFLSNTEVKAILDRSGTSSLPLALVDGVVTLIGRLPERKDLARWAGLPLDEPAVAASSSSCCAPATPSASVEAATSSCCGSIDRA